MFVFLADVNPAIPGKKMHPFTSRLIVNVSFFNRTHYSIQATSAITLIPMTAEVYNIDLMATVQCVLGNP